MQIRNTMAEALELQAQIGGPGIRMVLVAGVESFEVYEDGETIPEDASAVRNRAIAAYTEAVQAHLDGEARLRGYDNIFTACTYADEPAVALFQQEGQALRAWRSLVWAKCHEVLGAVDAGQRAAPDAQQLISELPAAP